MSLEALMIKWLEKYDEITDINEELKEIQSEIENYKQEKRFKKVSEYEGKEALLLQIIEA